MRIHGVQLSAGRPGPPAAPAVGLLRHQPHQALQFNLGPHPKAVLILCLCLQLPQAQVAHRHDRLFLVGWCAARLIPALETLLTLYPLFLLLEYIFVV